MPRRHILKGFMIARIGIRMIKRRIDVRGFLAAPQGTLVHKELCLVSGRIDEHEHAIPVLPVPMRKQ